MPFCTLCGARLENGARFCTECGARVPEPMAASHAPDAQAQPSPAAGLPRAETAAPYDPTIYRAGAGLTERPRERKKNVGKLVFLILAALTVIAALIYVFSARASHGRESAAWSVADLGVYVARGAELRGVSVDVGALWEDGFSIELMEKGKCRVTVDGKAAAAKWNREDDGSFRLSGAGLSCEGTLRNGVLVLENVMDSGVELTFTKASVPLPGKPVGTPAPEERPDESSSVLGVYVAERGEAMGIEVSVADIWENGLRIELLENGVCLLNVDGTEGRCSWSLDGEELKITGALELEGTVRNGELALKNVGNLGVTLYFSRTGSPEAGSDAAEDSADYSAWAGEYYGYWTAYEVGGRFEEEGFYYHGCWDTCASLTVRGNRGELVIWDEDGDNVADAFLRFGPGAGEMGCATSTSGSFYSNDLSDGVWRIDPGEGMFSAFEGMLVISGRYSESEEDWLDYYILLRPWGMEWEDVKNADPSEMIYVDMLPRHYEEWYLPLIRAGEPMPEDFSGLYDD